MDIGLSNLAFEKTDTELLKILPEIGINNIELVYTKYNDWDKVTNDTNLYIKNLFEYYNLNIYSIQSIFYNKDILSFSEKNRIKEHLNNIFDICIFLNIKKIVFGSPSFRKLYESNIINILEIFDFIDDKLLYTDIKFLIEPNSRIYNTDFFYNPYEIFDILKNKKYKNISTMIDTHNLLLEKYDPIKIINENFEMIDHIHISEYGLTGLKDEKFHIEFSNNIKRLNYNGIIIFEIFKNSNILEDITKFTEIYY